MRILLFLLASGAAALPPPSPGFTKLGDGGCMAYHDNTKSATGFPPSKHFQKPSIQDCQNACHGLNGLIGFQYSINSTDCLCFGYEASVFGRPGSVSTGEPAIHTVLLAGNEDFVCYTYEPPSPTPTTTPAAVTDTTTTPSPSSGGLSDGEIAGMAAGIAFVVFVIAVLVYYYCYAGNPGGGYTLAPTDSLL